MISSTKFSYRSRFVGVVALLGSLLSSLANKNAVKAFSAPSLRAASLRAATRDRQHGPASSRIACPNISFARRAQLSNDSDIITTTTISDSCNDKNNNIQDRRKAMGAISTALISGLLLSSSNKEAAFAYEKTFPVELDTVDADTKTPRQRALEEATKPKPSPLESSTPIDLSIGAFLWGSALWFLAGSRSNPLATGLANLLYNSNDEEWLQDRNDGLFAALPAPLLLLLGTLFLVFGVSAHLAAIAVTDGSVGISLQLASVLLIGAGTLEIGRFANGEKKQTRSDFDRDTMLEQEFEEFAEKRLKPGGDCHRSEVVKAFRRFHAKYRQVDNPDYPLNDLEIEQLLRQWNQKNFRAQRSSAGFYTGIQINSDADVFVQR